MVHRRPSPRESDQAAMRLLAFALRRRGQLWVEGNSCHNLLFAPHQLDAESLQEILRLLHSYSFRLFLRELLRHRKGFRLEEVLRYVSPEVAQDYCKKLVEWNVLEGSLEDGWSLLSKSIRSFGETLEWYVAQIFSEILGCPTVWGVRATSSHHGGDYDVLSLVEGQLVYIEVKSSPPRHLSQEHILNFLRRVEDLGPHLAIFLEDTHLRLQDKVLPLFAESLREEYGVKAELLQLFCQERRHLFSLVPPAEIPEAPPVLIMNSRPSIEKNLIYATRRLLVKQPWFQNNPSFRHKETEDPTLPPEPPSSPWSLWPQSTPASDTPDEKAPT